MENKRNKKFGLSNYPKPTPKRMRQIGDALLAVSLFISGSSIYLSHEWIGFVSLATGVVGKFLTNMFSE